MTPPVLLPSAMQEGMEGASTWGRIGRNKAHSVLIIESVVGVVSGTVGEKGLG